MPTDTHTQTQTTLDTDLTGADAPEIGVTLTDRTHYAHTRYAASDEAGVVWYDPRDGREYYATGTSGDDLTTVGDETRTSVEVTPYQPTEFGTPAARYVVNQHIARYERRNAECDWRETFETVGHYGRSEVFDSLDDARAWCCDHVDGYASAPRRDAVGDRTDIEIEVQDE